MVRFFQMEVNRNTYCCSANADGSLDATLFCHMTLFTTPITLTHVEESIIVAILWLSFYERRGLADVELIEKDLKGRIINA